MYRGMHHPLDVAGGVLVGIGALLVLLFACRAAAAAVQEPAAGRSRMRARGRMQAAS
jgi:membrane-associated phospholipid phosphatase